MFSLKIGFENIFYIFSLCNIRDFITIKNVDDSIVDQVQDFVRTELPPILTEWISSGKIRSVNKVEYFGEIYASNPNSFKFVSGDRIQINQIVKYAEKLVEENQNNPKNCVQPISGAPNSNARQSNLFKYDVNNSKQSEREKPYFLNKLNANADQNGDREPGGFRYDMETQCFSIVLRGLSGPLAYDMLQKNLEGSIPSLPSVNRYIYKSNRRVVEGVLRCDELCQYIEERNLEKVVTLSEDATRIVGRVQYDKHSNQMVGFVLPLNKKNGLPIPFAYPARNSPEIISHFEKNIEASCLVNVIMAKPVSSTPSPAFCLLLYGTDNTNTSDDVCNRWGSVTEQLKTKGIRVLSISSDSDPRYNTAMRKLSQLGNRSKTVASPIWFCCGDRNFAIWNTHCYQDYIHILTKLRNFFLKTIYSPCKLPFGKYHIKQSHLIKLIVEHSKDLHNLSPMVLNPIDKQNYESAERMFHKRVTNLLRKSVDDSEGTIKFLEIMRSIKEAFMDELLTPLERVNKAWYSVFIIRMWRAFINSNRRYTLKKNFLTNNCYACIELNAHSLVLCMVQLKNLNMPHLFLPTLFNSQHCESLFRQIRSISSTFSTITNCTVKEMTERISKIQLQSDIMTQIGSNFIFPRLNRQKNSKIKVYDLPTLAEIYKEIEKSKCAASKDAVALGLIKKNQVARFDFACKIKPYKKKESNKRKKTKNGSHFAKQCTRVLHLNKIDLKNFADKFIDKEVDANSPYVELYHDKETNRRMIVKKTSLCWLLRSDNKRLSSDRLQRVRMETRSKTNKIISTMRKR